MFGIGAWELTIIFAIVLVLFGGKRLPEVATGLGQAINNFRQALKSAPEENSNLLTDKNQSSKDLGTQKILNDPTSPNA